MGAIWRIDPGWGITAVRLATGLILLLAGWAKFMVGTGAVAAHFAKLGVPFPEVSGPFILLLETIGGAMLILGVATRWVALLFALEFLVATFVESRHAFGAARLPILLLATNILLFLAGPGRVAIDGVWLEKQTGRSAPRLA
ncbi:MAG: DoxX family protein [Candidatus Limnocylindria bacterium]